MVERYFIKYFFRSSKEIRRNLIALTKLYLLNTWVFRLQNDKGRDFSTHDAYIQFQNEVYVEFLLQMNQKRHCSLPPNRMVG